MSAERFRTSFLEARAERQRFDSDQAVFTARQMVMVMDGGDDFSIEDFLFAATMGHPEQFEDDERTLLTLSQLEGGGLIGALGEDGHLQAIGLTAAKPFVMIVRDGLSKDERGTDNPREQYRRELAANVRFSAMFERQIDYSYSGGRRSVKFVEAYETPQEYPILRVSAEPPAYKLRDGSTSSVFYEPRTIVLGAFNIMNALEDPDTIDNRLVVDGIGFIERSVRMGLVAPAADVSLD